MIVEIIGVECALRGSECIWVSLNKCLLSNCWKRHGILSLMKHDAVLKGSLQHPWGDSMVIDIVRATWEVHRHFYKAESWQTWVWCMWEHTRLFRRDSIWARPWREGGVFDCWRCAGCGGGEHPKAQRTVSTLSSHKVHRNCMCNVCCFLKAS